MDVYMCVSVRICIEKVQVCVFVRIENVQKERA